MEKCKSKLPHVIASHQTVRSHSIIRKATNNKCWRGRGEKGTLPTLLVGMQFGADTVKNSGRALKTENRDTV